VSAFVINIVLHTHTHSQASNLVHLQMSKKIIAVENFQLKFCNASTWNVSSKLYEERERKIFATNFPTTTILPSARCMLKSERERIICALNAVQRKIAKHKCVATSKLVKVMM
jgi:hypothetical protein